MEIIDFPVTGQRMEVLEAPDRMNGFRLRLRFTLRPHSAIAGAHFHPDGQQTFIVESGVLSLRRGDEVLELREGAEATVPPGVLHDQWNASDAPISVIEISEPAPRALPFLRTLATLELRGETDAMGRPSFFTAAAIFAEYADAIIVGPRVLRVLFTLTAPLATLLGYRRRIKAMAVDIIGAD